MGVIKNARRLVWLFIGHPGGYENFCILKQMLKAIPGYLQSSCAKTPSLQTLNVDYK